MSCTYHTALLHVGVDPMIPQTKEKRNHCLRECSLPIRSLSQGRMASATLVICALHPPVCTTKLVQESRHHAIYSWGTETQGGYTYTTCSVILAGSKCQGGDGPMLGGSSLGVFFLLLFILPSFLRVWIEVQNKTILLFLSHSPPTPCPRYEE